MKQGRESVFLEEKTNISNLPEDLLGNRQVSLENDQNQQKSGAHTLLTLKVLRNKRDGSSWNIGADFLNMNKYGSKCLFNCATMFVSLTYFQRTVLIFAYAVTFLPIQGWLAGLLC